MDEVWLWEPSQSSGRVSASATPIWGVFRPQTVLRRVGAYVRRVYRGNPRYGGISGNLGGLPDGSAAARAYLGGAHGLENHPRDNYTEEHGTMRINFTTIKATLMGLTVLAMALAGSAGSRWG